ncbi:SRPBCC family protein [Caballeronia sp. GAWG2-1]|uniref:SRPBCC family protein n=1 Tax=Caballeronia sp. GAWG2-1 TaxID=2921744 RepID=UPI00202965C5|nr:SRPBCC family protein [Caballeronia sp. GAWG2-1]
MTNGNFASKQGEPSQSGRSLSAASTSGSSQGLGWFPLTLGAASIVVGLGGRNKGALALALTALAGVAAVRSGHLDLVKVGSGRPAGASSGEPEVERSITIGKTADELRDCWLDPRTLPKIMAGFASVRPTGDGRMHWKVQGPLGRAYEWDTETVDLPRKGIGWRSSSNAAIYSEGSVRFSPAPADRGTEATLHFRLDPPGGDVGEALLNFLGTTPLDLVADGALRRFKSLIETGEIPTTGRQPAARPDTR